jgi:phospholipid-binding lipoprotein MlaA
VKPAAEIYRGLVPEIVRTGISNFFSNINDVIVALNNLLQGKFEQAVSDVVRVVINTTVGVLGAIDVATEIGLEKHNEDFGQTLGYWGFGSGPYLVLPILGPSSLRDSVGLFVDVKTDPKSYVDPVRDRNALYALYFVSRRSELLDAGRLLEVAALDPYEFLRDAYLQRRRNLVYDGAAPDEDEIETKPGPKKPSGGSSRAPRPVASNEGSAVESVLISGDRFPTPAEIEARERAAQAAAPARQLRSEAAPESARNTRVVRVWVPGSRN